ncbi:MAG: transporter, permease protein [Phenylobacterium sp.]|uniref:ABC transporter permease n=1 Tax=Phenylobacterium sp. TaxID=1871053 RepID=UPI00260EAFB9|nr:MlaE family lipid ABC transporter permease subunit [Phenylobacterium sp.]MDB5427500.1 transporter, permease protein [Phenylobacterium sp.]MDB5435252.1 transporter, permease protein [Phenylobacterium sp.]MDB5462976.1 transporter, permease protein [Phenylobacterium sp.]MDB5499156.1 transporter, permease protein [Phenylobacterium sp.]
MEKPAEFSVQAAGERPTVVLSGDWTANNLGDAPARLAEALTGHGDVVADIRKVRRLDTAGAYGLVRALGHDFDLKTVLARPESERLLELVGHAVHAQTVKVQPPRGFHELTVRIGKGVMNVGYEWVDTLAFLGHLLVVVARTAVYLFTNPKRIRWAAIFSLAERAGLDAIPIVAVTSFFIGAVVGLLGANMLRQFGAEVFAVELIGIAVLREFNIIITAVLLAGRSASSFAAELGSMKMNQEIDAMQVMGVDPFEALVLPRFLALLLTIPLLTFVATLAGLFGGLVVVWTALSLGPTFFLQRIVDNVGAVHFWVGMSKAPVMAMVIAGIGCRQGLEVGGDVESLGRRVTAAVVHAIFAIIMIDAAFALMFMKLNI